MSSMHGHKLQGGGGYTTLKYHKKGGDLNYPNVQPKVTPLLVHIDQMSEGRHQSLVRSHQMSVTCHEVSVTEACLLETVSVSVGLVYSMEEK